MRVYTGLITGHNRLQKHMHRMNMLDFDSPFCEKCLEDVEETTTHFLGQCIAHCNTRFQIFGKQLSIQQLRNTNINKICKFVKATGRQLQITDYCN